MEDLDTLFWKSFDIDSKELRRESPRASFYKIFSMLRLSCKKIKVLNDKNAISLGSKVASELKYKPNGNSNKNAETVIWDHKWSEMEVRRKANNKIGEG